MKINPNKLKISLFLAAFVLLTNTAFALERDYDSSYDYYEDNPSYDTSYQENWEIKSFNSEIFLNQNGKVKIIETIVADFTNEFHRGLQRDIPAIYVNDYNSRIKFISATNENNNSWNNEVDESNGWLSVKMYTNDYSDLKSEATFKITYEAENVISFFEDYDEFYWNVNGTYWPITNKSTTAKIHLPENVEKSKIELTCLTGFYGESEDNCDYEYEDEKTIIFSATNEFDRYEGLTIGVKLPPNTISKPSKFQEAIWFLMDNKLIPLPIVTFLIMLALWLKYGRDEKTIKNTIVPHYTPPKGLLPSESGTIIDETVNPADITATIIDHAIKGEIKITDLGNEDFELELIKPYEITKDFESKILKGVFDYNKKGEKKKISELRNKFYTHLYGIHTALNQELIQNGYFKKSPQSIRATYYSLGGAIAFLSFALIGFSTPANFLSAIITGIIIMIFGRFMPSKTQKGTETYYQLKGLYEYIDTAEKDRMKFQENHKILFEKLLPYAMAFGLVKKWAAAFDGILATPPKWFVSSTNQFNFIHFSNALNNFSSHTSTYLNSQPGGKGGSGGWSGGSSFGGGGFSGGGFGGGGGRGL